MRIMLCYLIQPINIDNFTCKVLLENGKKLQQKIKDKKQKETYLVSKLNVHFIPSAMAVKI